MNSIACLVFFFALNASDRCLRADTLELAIETTKVLRLSESGEAIFANSVSIPSGLLELGGPGAEVYLVDKLALSADPSRLYVDSDRMFSEVQIHGSILSVSSSNGIIAAKTPSNRPSFRSGGGVSVAKGAPTVGANNDMGFFFTGDSDTGLFAS